MKTPDHFDTVQRRILERHLGTDRRDAPPLSYPQTAGFLYAVVASPEVIQPSEWMETVLGASRPPMKDETEAEAFFNALMGLNNYASEQLFADHSAFPPGCEPPPDVATALEPGPFCQFIQGLLGGHGWLAETWEAYLDEEKQEAMDAIMGPLTLLSGRESVEALLAEEQGKDFGEPAPETPDSLVSELLPSAHELLGAYLDQALALRASPEQASVGPSSTPYRRAEPRVGRNDRCPCGSGRKYKRCCGQRVH